MQRLRGKEGDVSNCKTRIADDWLEIKPPNSSSLRAIVGSNLEGSLVVGFEVRMACEEGTTLGCQNGAIDERSKICVKKLNKMKDMCDAYQS